MFCVLFHLARAKSGTSAANSCGFTKISNIHVSLLFICSNGSEQLIKPNILKIKQANAKLEQKEFGTLFLRTSFDYTTEESQMFLVD